MYALEAALFNSLALVGFSLSTRKTPHSAWCSKKIHLRSYLETLWPKTGYFGLLGNNHILFIILLYLIEG